MSKDIWYLSKMSLEAPKKIAVIGNIAGQVTLRQGDAELLQLRRHRRIYGLIATFDRMAEFARERGDSAHEGTGDAEDVEFHCMLRASAIARTHLSPVRRSQASSYSAWHLV